MSQVVPTPADSLRYRVQLAAAFPDISIVSTLSAKLSGTHFLQLLARRGVLVEGGEDE